MEEPKQEEKPLSLVEEAKAIRDEIIKQKEELAEERKKLEVLQSERLLSSSAGGHIEAPLVSEEDLKHKQAKEFWGEGLIGDALKEQEKKNG